MPTTGLFPISNSNGNYSHVYDSIQSYFSVVFALLSVLYFSQIPSEVRYTFLYWINTSYHPSELVLSLLLHALHICRWTENGECNAMRSIEIYRGTRFEFMWTAFYVCMGQFRMQITLIIIRLLCMLRASSVCVCVYQYHDRFFSHCFGHVLDLFLLLFTCSDAGIFPPTSTSNEHTFHTFYAWATIKLLGMEQRHTRVSNENKI